MNLTPLISWEDLNTQGGCASCTIEDSNYVNRLNTPSQQYMGIRLLEGSQWGQIKISLFPSLTKNLLQSLIQTSCVQVPYWYSYVGFSRWLIGDIPAMEARNAHHGTQPVNWMRNECKSSVFEGTSWQVVCASNTRSIMGVCWQSLLSNQTW
jgi:hypothetical protein